MDSIAFVSNENVLLAIGIIVAVSIISSIAVLVYILRLPSHYIVQQRSSAIGHVHPVIYWSKVMLKNLFGLLLLITGVVMLFTPGQGLLTILIGIMLTDFPGKDRIEKKILTQPKILILINRIRVRFNKPCLVLD